MKRRSHLLLCLLLCLLTAGCGFSNRELWPSEPSEEPSSVTEPSREEPSPPPDLSKLSPLSCMEDCGQIETIVECGEGLLAAVSVPRADHEGQGRILTVCDAEADAILTEARIPAEGELLCADSSGRLLFFDRDALTVSLYEPDGSLDRKLVLPEAPSLFDGEEDLFYFTDSRLETMDLGGKTETLLTLAASDRVLTYHPERKLAVIDCRSDDDNSSSLEETVLYDLDAQKTLFCMVDDISFGYHCYEDMFIANRILRGTHPDGSDVFSRVICSYDLNDNKWGDGYRLDLGLDLTPLDEKGWFLASNNGLYEEDQPPLHLVNALDGRTVCFDSLTKDTEYCGCGVESLDCGAIAAYDPKTGNSCVYLFDPRLVTATGSLEKAELPSPKEPSAPKAGKHLEKQRKQADALEKEFGVTVLIGDEIKSARQNDVFENISIEDSEVYTTEEEQCEITETMLRMLRTVLSRYGKTFFDRFRDFKGEGGLRLLLADSIRSKSGSFSAGAYTTPVGSLYTICLRADSFTDDATVRTILDHELWHGVEGRVSDQTAGQFDPEDWNRLNAEGFVYTNDFESAELSETYDPYLLTRSRDDSRVCVIGPYSAINEKEDRATLAETILSGDLSSDTFAAVPGLGSYATSRELVLHYPLLRQKYAYMQRAVEPVFGDSYLLFAPEPEEARD